jgi:hypothetical protein
MKWKGVLTDEAVAYLRYHPGICLQEPKKYKNNLSHGSRPPGTDLSPGPPEYDAGS